MTSRTRRRSFPRFMRRFKFCILNFGGEQAAASQADFVFFAHRVEELEDRKRHIALERRRHPAAESQYANVPDLPHAARRGNHQGHLPPRSRLDRHEPRGTNRQPVGHPVQDDVPSNERRRTVPRSRHAQGGRFQAERQSVDQGEDRSFCRFTKRRCFRTTTTGRPTS